MIATRYDIAWSSGGSVTVEVEVDTSGERFDALVRHLARRAEKSRSGTATVAGGVVRVKVVDRG